MSRWWDGPSRQAVEGWRPCSHHHRRRPDRARRARPARRAPHGHVRDLPRRVRARPRPVGSRRSRHHVLDRPRRHRRAPRVRGAQGARADGRRAQVDADHDRGPRPGRRRRAARARARRRGATEASAPCTWRPAPRTTSPPARRLYERAGFVECPPFADYVLDPHSVFYRLTLTSAARQPCPPPVPRRRDPPVEAQRPPRTVEPAHPLGVPAQGPRGHPHPQRPVEPDPPPRPEGEREVEVVVHLRVVPASRERGPPATRPGASPSTTPTARCGRARGAPGRSTRPGRHPRRALAGPRAGRRTAPSP